MTAVPIGVFDSGVGGLSILSGIHALLPAEDLIYVADSAHAPYGPKGEGFIRQRCTTIVTSLLEHNVKAVVVACNTATAAAVAQLRAQHSVPIIGVEPALKPAAALSRSGVVGVLATSGTIASDKFLNLQSLFASRVEFITRACTGLVEHIEQLAPDADALRGLLETFIHPLLERRADTLVLGCTHYSLIRDLIQAVAGKDIAIVDAGSAVAKELQRRLLAEQLLETAQRRGEVRFLTSGNPALQSPLISRYWGAPAGVGLLQE